MQRIVVCGDSVIMSSIGASLSREGWEVTQLDAGQPNAAEQVRCLSPQALVYDIARAPATFVHDVLTDCPALLLVGVDTSGDRMLVLSSQQARAETTNDLLQLLMGCTGGLVPTRHVN